jgi:hypothetical protein
MTKKELKKLRKDVLSDKEREALQASRDRANARQVEQNRVAAVLAKQPEQMTADEQDILRRACLVAITE